MMRKAVIYFFFIGMHCYAISQVNVSDAFQSTLKKISKERIKDEIVNWISGQDEIFGIVSKDLITQLVDNGKNEDAVLRSTSNVTATMLYLGGIKRIAEVFLSEHTELVDSAAVKGLSRRELVAYTAMYYYFSERIKYHLYVSPEILRMQGIKNTIASMRTRNRTPLPVEFARYIGKMRRESDYIDICWLDVRVLEYIQLSFTTLLLHPTLYRSSVESTMVSLRTVISDQSISMMSGMEFLRKSSKSLVTAYQKSYETSTFFILDRNTFIDHADPANSSFMFGADDVNNILADPFNNLIQSSEYSFVDLDGAKKVLISIVRQLLEQWMMNANQSGWKWNYTFALGASYFPNYGSAVDFTIVDQVRLGTNWENSSLYFFVGGFFDPLIKSTVNKNGTKLYLAGFGYQWSGINVNVVLGIPYTDINSKYGKGISVGYEVPIIDVIE